MTWGPGCDEMRPLAANGWHRATVLHRLTSTDDELNGDEGRVDLLCELSHRLVRILVRVRVDVDLVCGTLGSRAERVGGWKGGDKVRVTHRVGGWLEGRRQGEGDSQSGRWKGGDKVRVTHRSGGWKGGDKVRVTHRAGGWKGGDKVRATHRVRGWKGGDKVRATHRVGGGREVTR